MNSLPIRPVIILLASVSLLIAAIYFALPATETKTIPVEKLTESIPDSELIALPDVTEEQATVSPFQFTDVTNDTGIDFRYFGSPSPQQYMTEQNGGGIALFDYDGDDLLDMFLVNGSHFGNPAQENNASSALFRGLGDFKFSPATSESSLTQFGFGMGCAAGDYDNDGFPDLFVAGYEQNRLWKNLGDGTFSEVVVPGFSQKARWSTSAAWADFDADGDLDLYVVNYVDYSATDPPCFSQHTPPIPIPCGPIGRTGQTDLLYENRGDGSFRDASETSGIGAFAGKGLGVTIADFNDDRLLDIYVANDTSANLLFLNRGGMQFEETGLTWGVAVGSEGVARSGMGVSSADINRDGRFDLFVTNFMNEPNDLYENLGDAGFVASNTRQGLNAPSRQKLAFGTVFADFELDGDPDLFVTNGHVWDLRPAGLGYEFAMTPQIFANDSTGRFEDVASASGDYFQQQWVGRSAAVGDLDHDGDPDLTIGHLIEPVAVLRNDSPRIYDSVRVELSGTASSRDALAVTVEVKLSDQILTLRVPSGDSFQSSSDPRLLIPVVLGTNELHLRVHWPGQPLEDWRTIDLGARKNPDQTLLIRE